MACRVGMPSLAGPRTRSAQIPRALAHVRGGLNPEESTTTIITMSRSFKMPFSWRRIRLEAKKKSVQRTP
jgi:hypothetical protein